VLAGPGSGKTKTLTTKLARMLAEDVDEPRGVACITYNNECAKELEQRLDTLGIEPCARIFIGTVHSFSLTQIILPYANLAGLNLPDDFRVATQQEQRSALEVAFEHTIGGAGNPNDWSLSMSNYRRSILNRESVQWRTTNPQLAALVEAYEGELRTQGLIDFDDMPLLAVKALRQHQWLQRAIHAKYPILIVDEYQDLGRALHGIVMGLCFSTGIRLFAVGDADQSIYGFTGAHPDLLQRLSEREDVETVRLRFNYRCGARIVEASQYALGEDRDYQAPDDAHEGTIFFHPRAGQYDQHANYLFETLLPRALERMPDVMLGDVAILYPAAWIGDPVFNAAQMYGIGVIRTDGNALYPRSSRLMRWFELCAIWCCNGWRSGTPRFSKLLGEGFRIFAEYLTSDDLKIAFQRDLMGTLWSKRNSTYNLNEWLGALYVNMISDLISRCRTLDDERVILTNFMGKTAEGGELSEMTLGQFSGHGEGNDRVNLSTLHSSKGREFKIVFLFGMDNGRLPRNNPTERELREARRLFYVGFTRAKSELHIIFTANRQSPFVEEVQQRLDVGL
jgi:DNA helicase-2/ATP-dependent DNA helicase PcrA